MKFSITDFFNKCDQIRRKDYVAIDVKMNGSVLEEKLSFNMLGLFFSPKFDRSCHVFCVCKNVSKKIAVIFVL